MTPKQYKEITNEEYATNAE
ncbi:hypothetical protein [Bacillus altitudinis]|nr:hypothetical protein [Bacillus altitudinis]MED0684525.1 hypothetical protein [Bacillus altitudinis]WLF32442.1 hypothetical protein Q6357_10155 [Bacillus altitudinis]